MREYKQSFCHRCGFERMFSRRDLDQQFHLLASVVTLGLWLIPWLILKWVQSRRPWRCCICGSRADPTARMEDAAPEDGGMVHPTAAKQTELPLR